MKPTDVLLTLVFLALLVGALMWWQNRYNECRAAGFSRSYCTAQ